jgi:predicted permease
MSESQRSDSRRSGPKRSDSQRQDSPQACPSRPDWKAEIRKRLAGAPVGAARGEEIADELAQHLDDRYAELVRGGTPEPAAEQAALAELEASDVLREGLGRLRAPAAPATVLGQALGGGPLQGLLADVRFGLRSLRKSPGFTATAVLTLALGIGGNTAVFSLVNAVLLQRLPVRESERLVHLTFEGGGMLSFPDYADLRDHQRAFDGFAAFGGIQVSLNRGGEAELAGGLIVTGNYFEVLGARPELGRLIASSDDVRPGAHPVLVLSHGVWRSRFASEPGVVGRELLVNGHRFTVIGVAPEGFQGSQLGVERGLYIPMMMQAIVRPPRAGYSGEMDPDLLRSRNNRWLTGLGRLQPGTTAEQAASALTSLAVGVMPPRPAGAPKIRMATMPVDVGDARTRAQLRSAATLLMAVVGTVLLLACANVANLMLSQAAARRREIALRLALGASRARVVRQLLTESVLLAAFGGLAGLLLTWWTLAAFRGAAPPPGALPVAIQAAVDVRVLAFTFVLALLAGILFGLAPGLTATGGALVPALKDESFVPDERARRFNLRSALVVSQVSLSLLLLVTAGLFLRNLRELQAIGPGFDVERLLSAQLPVNLLRYTQDQGRAFYRSVVERVEALPGVESASVARVGLLDSGGGRVSSLHVEGRSGRPDRFQSEGGGASAPGRDAISSNVIGPGYFATLGVALVAGRDFDPRDVREAPQVAVVNESFWRVHFADQQRRDVLGQRISLNGPEGPWREIVGVVGDSKYWSLTEQPTPVAYLPLSQQHETGVVLYVRTGAAPASLIAAVRREVQSLEPNLPLPELRTVSETVSSSLYAARMGARLLAVFGGLALLLAAIGVYSVISYGVAQRTREIGVRMALGAGSSDVQGLVLRRGLRLVALGVVVGLALALVAGRFLESFLHGVRGNDPLTFVAVPVVLTAVAFLACLLPARRATKLDPLAALRQR